VDAAETARLDRLAQQLQGAIERNLDDRAAARRPCRHLDEPLHFERLERLARRALAHGEELLQLDFTQQLVPGLEILFRDQPLDLFCDEVGALRLLDRLLRDLDCSARAFCTLHHHVDAPCLCLLYTRARPARQTWNFALLTREFIVSSIRFILFIMINRMNLAEA